MKNMKLHSSDERGVALVFALGILSLLLVLGLAFVSSALLSQKVAANNGNRTQAKTLAQTAINRVAMAIMIFQNKLVNSDGGDGSSSSMLAADDFTSIRSYSDSTNDEYLDQLKEKLWYIGSYKFEEPDTDSEKAQWIYIKSGISEGSGDASDGRIIGRIAYRVLPSGRINLAAVLGGAVENEPEVTDDKMVPWANRRGKDIEELYINDVSYLDSGSPTRWKTLFTDAKVIPNSFASFFMAYKNDLPKLEEAETQQWFMRWFAEGNQPEAIEAYYDSEDELMYHRFNVGNLLDSDSWYARFNGATGNENTDALLSQHLTVDNASYLEGDRDDYPETGSDGKQSSPGGLPFLRRIGDSPESFDSLVNRRKQVAANFNDYCDDGSIPTAEPQASSWTLDSSVNYSGNERTLYINELGIGGSVRTVVDDCNLKVKIVPTIAAELIDIYGDVSGTYSLSARLASMEMAASGECSVKFQYSGADGNPVTDTTTVATSGSKTFSMANAKDGIINSFTSSGGYYFGSVDLEEFPAEDNSVLISRSDIESACRAKQPTLLADSIEVTSYTVNVESDSFKFTAGPLMLNDGSNNVDFTNKQDAEVTFNSDAKEIKVDSSVGTAHNQLFMIGGMEVKDPRQNLNIKVDYAKTGTLAADYKKSDWIFDPVFKWMDAGADVPMSVTASFVESDTLKNSLTAVTGKVNSQSNPSAPGPLNEGEFDPETVTDPAWDSTNKTGISTAFIRNKPMQSPWEIGAIHRGAAWETINIKAAESFPHKAIGNDKWEESGTSYADGDGAILDQIKMTPYARSYGKVDINMLSNANDTTGNQQMARALLTNILVGEDLRTFSDTKREFSTAVTAPARQLTASDVANAAEELMKFTGLTNRAGILQGDQGEKLWQELIKLSDSSIQKTDAGQEELIGKFIALTTARGGLPTTIRAIILAQTINDIGGTGGDVNVTRPYTYQGKVETVSRNCRIGRFDMDNDQSTDDGLPVYFDEITGEVKMLVTFSRNPQNGRLAVRSIEYIE